MIRILRNSFSAMCVGVVIAMMVGCSYQEAPVAPVFTLPPPDAVTIDVAEPTSQSPVTWGAAMHADPIAPGAMALLVVRAKIAEGWHIYAAEGEVGVGRPTKLNAQLPPGLTAVGEWTLPHAEVKSTALGDVAEYHGTIEFSLPVKVADDVTVGGTIACGIDFQSCTDSSCLPPSSTELSISYTLK